MPVRCRPGISKICWLLGAQAIRIDRVEILHFCLELFAGFHVARIGQAYINWADGSALRFVVKAYTFCTFIGDNIISFIGPEFTVKTTRRGRVTVCFSGEFPRSTGFINSVVRAFRFTCPAIDTIFDYMDGHWSTSHCEKCPLTTEAHVQKLAVERTKLYIYPKFTKSVLSTNQSVSRMRI